MQLLEKAQLSYNGLGDLQQQKAGETGEEGEEGLINKR
jgi:hypothetical protein